jgi:hypothetical protein
MLTACVIGGNKREPVINETVVRPVLYYPYIHIRSEHWLKATLLCVPTSARQRGGN